MIMTIPFLIQVLFGSNPPQWVGIPAILHAGKKQNFGFENLFSNLYPS